MRQSWYYRQLGEDHGPVSSTDLRALAHNGAIRPDTLVKPRMDASWVLASRVAGLFQPTEKTSPEPDDDNDSITITRVTRPVERAAPGQLQTSETQEPARYPALAWFVRAARVLALFVGASSVAGSVVAIVNSMWLSVPVLILAGIVGGAGVVLAGEVLRVLMDIEENTRQGYY